ncbi:MAG: winged helix-turn-helix domain-containing protein [Candidatus Micrarchaeota archaeon]|nr:winged helix-turn-helix domain-containing protein [Candidatus Micrarchaeota archaeon]
MKKPLSLVLLLMLALPLAYATSSASFSTGSASLPENIEMSGHFGNYTLVAFSSDGKVAVSVIGADGGQAALASEINWLVQNERLHTTCDIGAMPTPAKGQEAYCNAAGAWEGESVTVPAPAPSQDTWGGRSEMAIAGAPTGKSLEAPLAPAAAQQEIGTEQVLQLLGAFLAVLVASYLILQSRHEPMLDAAAEKLLDNPTRAGIMEELSSADKIPTDISAKLGKSKASVVEHLAALSEAGLVERIAQPGKKFVFYKLTQKGRQMLLRRAG